MTNYHSIREVKHRWAQSVFRWEKPDFSIYLLSSITSNLDIVKKMGVKKNS